VFTSKGQIVSALTGPWDGRYGYPKDWQLYLWIIEEDLAARRFEAALIILQCY
jgi:hypothetical protein